MSISEESNGALSLDALLGVQPTVEEPPAVPEPTPTASFDLLSALAPAPASDPAPVPSASLDLLSALGLVPVEPETKEPAPAEPSTAAATSALDLASLLGTSPELDSEPTVELQSEPAPEPAPSPKPEPAPVRSRFADIPPFRSPEERTESPTPKAPEPPQKEPTKEHPLKAEAPVPEETTSTVSEAEVDSINPAPLADAPSSAASVETTSPETPETFAGSVTPMSTAVKYLVGESRPLALSEQCIDRASALDDSPSEQPKADESAPASPSAPHPSASAKSNPVEPSPVTTSAPAPAPAPTPAAKPSPAPSPKPAAPKPVAPKKQRPSVPTPATKPISASATTPAAPPAAVPAAASQTSNPTARPQRSTSPEKSAKRSGIWYLLGVCLFAIALACACYALYSSAASYAAPPLVSSGAEAPTQAASRTFRYSVQGSDGTVRTVTEQVQLNVDGFVAETTISFNAESEAEAAWFLDDAKSQFGDAWVSGSVQGTQATFTLLPARTDLNAEAYEALLKSNTTDCTVVS